MYLNDPTSNRRLAELTDDEGQDGTCCDDNKYLRHDSTWTSDMLEVQEGSGFIRKAAYKHDGP